MTSKGPLMHLAISWHLSNRSRLTATSALLIASRRPHDAANLDRRRCLTSAINC